MKTFQQVIAESNSICDLLEAGQHSVAATQLSANLTVLKQFMNHADQTEGTIRASLDECMKTKPLPTPSTGFDEENTTYP